MMQFQMGGSSSKRFEVEKQTATQNVESFDLKQYRKQCLEQINKYRSRHGVSAMVMDEEINRYAQDWADYLAQRSMFEHRKEHKYGENLGAVSSIQRQNIIEMWYNEYDKYRFSHQGFASGTGHFTQIVWKA